MDGVRHYGVDLYQGAQTLMREAAFHSLRYCSVCETRGIRCTKRFSKIFSVLEGLKLIAISK